MRITRKINLALSAAMCLLALSACQRENKMIGSSTGKIKTRVSASGSSTKAANITDEELNQIILMDDDSLMLQEFVSDNLSQPFAGGDSRTKGTVITTDNISEEYGEFGMEGFLDNYDKIDCDPQNRPELTNGDQYIMNGKVSYEEGSWNLKDTKGNQYSWLSNIHFTFWSRAPLGHSGTDSYGSTSTRSVMKITDYVNQTDAAKQQDLLVAYNNRWYNDQNKDEFVNVNFRHALADIYFDVEPITDLGFSVTGIEITGAYSKGSCTITGTDLNDTDVTKAFAWAPDTKSAAKFEMEGAADHFLMIPQALPEGTTIGITLKKDDAEITRFAKLSTTWLAGKYYKYKLQYIDGDISVEVSEDFNEEVKENVGAKNTSVSKAAFVRMAITSNWVDDKGLAVAHCDFEKEGNLDGYLESSNWVKHTDGYYYYKMGIRPGAKTADLFTSYKPATPPQAGLNLKMVVIAQAVEYDSNCAFAKAAWNLGDGILTSDIEE